MTTDLHDFLRDLRDAGLTEAEATVIALGRTEYHHLHGRAIRQTAREVFAEQPNGQANSETIL